MLICFSLRFFNLSGCRLYSTPRYLDFYALGSNLALPHQHAGSTSVVSSRQTMRNIHA